MNSMARRFALLLALLVVGCAGPTETVVLLPNPAGQETAVTVTRDGREVVLAQPYAGARLGRGGAETFASDAGQVRARYGAALAAQPLPPAQFTLFFVENKDELTDESKKIVDSVFAEIARRPIPDVIVIGHTDTVGNDAANDALSRQRAEVVRAACSRAASPPTRSSPSAAASASSRWPPATASPSRATGVSRSSFAEAVRMSC